MDPKDQATLDEARTSLRLIGTVAVDTAAVEFGFFKDMRGIGMLRKRVDDLTLYRAPIIFNGDVGAIKTPGNSDGTYEVWWGGEAQGSFYSIRCPGWATSMMLGDCGKVQLVADLSRWPGQSLAMWWDEERLRLRLQ